VVKNNPTLPVTESAGDHGKVRLNGSLDIPAPNGGMDAVLKDVTAAKEQAAPKNPAPGWSA